MTADHWDWIKELINRTIPDLVVAAAGGVMALALPVMATLTLSDGKKDGITID